MNAVLSAIKKVPLILQIIIGMILGIVAAYFCPEASWVSSFGDLFVSALKAVAPMLVLILVTSAVASHNTGEKIGLKSLVVTYVLSTLLAASLAVCASFIFPVTLSKELLLSGSTEMMAAPKGVMDVISNVLSGLIKNPVAAIYEANYLAILLWAVLIGLGLRYSAKETRVMLKDFADGISFVVKCVIRCAPLGVFGLVFASCTANGGFSNLLSFVRIIGLLVGVMAFMALVINPIIVFIITRKNPFPLVFATLRDSAYFAFFTRSSAANIPVNMSLCDKYNVPRSMSSISIPLGATVNMAGAAITISVLSLSAAFTLGAEIDIPTAILLSVISAVSACGASGVAGGSLLLIPLACSLFGINNDIAMHVVAIGMVIGVVQDSCETALNSSSDALYTIAISDRKKAR